MSIPDTFEFDNRGEVVRYPWARRYFLTAVILLVALLASGIGRLTGDRGEGRGVSINFDPNLLASSSPVTSTLTPGSVTASSQGTRYYYGHCSNTISERNKVTFATAALAEQAGYTLAANCKPK